MKKRADPWYKEADRQYPIRVKLVVPSGGLRSVKKDVALDDWLQANLGPKMWNWGPSGSNTHWQATAYYFRRMEGAQRFVEAFPHLELADGVAAPIDTTPAEHAPHQGWSHLGRGSPADD